MMSKDPVFSKTPIHLVIYIVIIIFQNVFFCVLQGYWTPHQLWLMQSHSLWRYFTHSIIVFSIKVLENSNSCPASKTIVGKVMIGKQLKTVFLHVWSCNVVAAPAVSEKRHSAGWTGSGLSLGAVTEPERAAATSGGHRRLSLIQAAHLHVSSLINPILRSFGRARPCHLNSCWTNVTVKPNALVHPDHSYSRCTVHAAFMLTVISTEKNDTNTLGMLYLLPEQWIIIDHRWIVAVLRSVVNGEGTTDYTYIVYSVL